MPIRYDRAVVKATRTPEGFVRDSPILSRVGIFEYRQPDGKVRREYRPAEEVFHQDHLDSIHLKPITEDHHGMITGANVRGKLVGSMVSPGRADESNQNLIGDVVVYDSNVLSSKKELSLTYQLELDETPGENEFGRYDAIQRKLHVNSVALCLRGRAGNSRLNLDAADAVSVSTEEDDTMPTVKIRLDSAPGIEYEASPEVALALGTLQGNLKSVTERADALTAERDTLKAKVDGHETAIAQVRADAIKTAEARVKLVADAKTIGASFAEDAKDADIKVAVIKKVRGDSADMTGKSDAYVDAMFDLAVADAAKAKGNAATNRATVTPAPGARADAADTGTAHSARDKMIADLKKTTTGA